MKTEQKARSNTKQEILELAEELFQTKGFNGFSYADIAKALEIKNAAVHYHFPSKTDLGVALIRRYRHLLQKASKSFMRTGENPVEQLEGYFQFCRRREKMGERICPIAVSANDYNTLPEEMQEESGRLAKETVVWLTRVLFEGKKQGMISFVGEAQGKALVIQAALQGAGQLCRFQGPEALTTIITQIRTELGLA